jgi:nucleoside-diphosphate-sugar epimerase
MKIFITGAAGYIGGMLVDLFLKDPRVEKVVALDMAENTKNNFPTGNQKFSWINFNLGDDGWQELVLKEGKPDVVIHCAYVIRQGYGKKREWQNKSNITAADKIFNFVFQNNISRLIHFSSVASYGARPENTVSRRFKEEDLLGEEKYLYGIDKKRIEGRLATIFEKEKNRLVQRARNFLPQVLIVRPCAISGPRGQFIFRRFGLLRLVKRGLPIIPLCGEQPARQFVHEDDVADIIFWLADGNVKNEYEIFNIAPADFFLLKDMAKAVGTASVRIPIWLGRLGFATLWHVFRGIFPTVPAGINSYAYPIIADGSKITRAGFNYKYKGADALAAKVGRYAAEAEKVKKK